MADSHNPTPPRRTPPADRHEAAPIPANHAEANRPALLTRRAMLRLSAGLAAGTALFGLPDLRVRALQAPKRIYIAPDDHTDLFWTADDSAYRDAFLRMLDYYLDQIDATAAQPADFQGRWNCDGWYWLWVYEQNRTPVQFERLIGRIRDGHISAPLNALVVCLGGAPAEAVLRGMYYPGTLERRYSLRFPLAVAMENQTFPYGLAALWAGAGARYSWKGICGCDTRVLDAGDRASDITWLTGPDGSRILMKWNSLLGANTSMGGYAEARDPQAVVDYVDTDPAFIARYPYRVIGAFGQGWDDFETLTDAFPTAAQAQSNAGRRVIVSSQTDFFADFESTYGASIPSGAASYGNDWDLYCAALAEVSGQVKRATEGLRGAEALAALVTLADPAFMTGREAARDAAWRALGLYWEHNFGQVGVFGRFGAARVAWQRGLAADLSSYVQGLQTDAIAALGGMIPAPAGVDRFFVFNPLSGSRTDSADLPYSGPEPVQVIDLTSGTEVPSQFVLVAGVRRLRILARDVPPVGYRVYEVQPGAGTAFPDAATVTGGVLDSARYRVTVAERGAILSLIDHAQGDRELVQTLGGLAANDLGAGNGSLLAENVGPVSATLVAQADGPLRHTTRVTLIRDVDRVSIENTITQNFDAAQSWAFSFDLAAPDVWHEEVGAVIRAKLQADGGHYAPRSARYDWLTLNHFAHMAGADGAGVTLSNADAYFMRLGNSRPDTLDTATPQINVLAGGRVGGEGTAGIPNQGGDDRFVQRFALRGTASTPGHADSMRFALEHQNPLVAGPVTGPEDAAVYPAENHSLLSIDNPNALLWALKPADDPATGNIVARVWHMAGGAGPFNLRFNGVTPLSARQITHIETPLRGLAVSGGGISDTAAPYQLRSYAFVMDPALVSPAAQPGGAVTATTARTNPTPGFPSRLPDTGYPPAGEESCGRCE